MTEKNEVATKEKKICGLTQEKIRQIETISQKFQLENSSVEGQLEKSLLVAQGIKALQEIITPEVMEPIMFLMGSKLGFRTDKDDDTKKYSVTEVKPVFIEAMLRGLLPAGNQFNIIAKGLYITKEGFTALLEKMEGLRNFTFNLELLDKTIGVNSIVSFQADWEYKGQADTLAGEIPVHTRPTDKVDGIMGKAERKMKYRVHCQVTGTQASVTDEGDASEKNIDVKKPSALEDQAKKVKDAESKK